MSLTLCCWSTYGHFLEWKSTSSTTVCMVFHNATCVLNILVLIIDLTTTLKLWLWVINTMIYFTVSVLLGNKKFFLKISHNYSGISIEIFPTQVLVHGHLYCNIHSYMYSCWKIFSGIRVSQNYNFIYLYHSSLQSRSKGLDVNFLWNILHYMWISDSKKNIDCEKENQSMRHHCEWRKMLR